MYSPVLTPEQIRFMWTKGKTKSSIILIFGSSWSGIDCGFVGDKTSVKLAVAESHTKD